MLQPELNERLSRVGKGHPPASPASLYSLPALDAAAGAVR